MSSQVLYRFSDVEIDPTRREVRRGGVHQPVEPKVFDVLLYLIQHRDRVVSKQELLERFWPQQDVYEGALNVCIHRCRRVIGDSARGPAIRTVAGHGYRFSASTVEHSEARGGLPLSETVPILVGRGHEQRRLYSAMQAVLAGGKRVVMIAGQAGIGKTSLLLHASQEARLRGFDVLWGDAGNGNSLTPFALWRDVLTAYAAWQKPNDLRAKLGVDAALVVRVAPVLAERLSVPKSVAAASNLDDRPRLFAAVARLLAPAEGQRPLALVIDALHDVGIASLRLLQELCTTLYPGPLLVIGAYRDTDYRPRPEATEVQSLLGDHWVSETLRLGPLPADEVRELITRRVGKSIASDLLDAVVRCAEGSPVIAVEHWQQLVRSGVAIPEAEAWVSRGDPAAILPTADRSSLLTRRIATLSPETQSVLDVAAVIGREVSLPLLRRVLSWPTAALIPALEEAALARILQRVRSKRDAWQFSHGLVRDFVYARLDENERALLHQRVGEAIEASLLKTDRRWLPVVAQHLLHGATSLTAGRAVSLAYRAGLHAFEMLAFEKAIRFFEQGLALLEAFHPEGSVDPWDLHFALAESCLRNGDIERARTALRAIDSASGGPSSIEQTRADESIETARLRTILLAGTVSVESESLDDALKAAEDRHQTLRRASDAARQKHHLGDLLAALLGRRWNLSVGPRMRERLALSTEAQLLAERVGSPPLLREATLLRIQDLLENTQRAEADRQITRFTSLAKDQPDPFGTWVAAYLPAMQAALDGRFALAQELAQQALLVAGMHLGELGLMVFGGQVNAVLTLQGRSQELAFLLEDTVRLQPHLQIARTTLARAYVESGRPDDARRALDMVRLDEFRLHPVAGVLWPNAAAGLARVYNRLGEAVKAAELLEVLLPYRDTCVMVPPAIVCVGSTAAHLGLLAATAGRWGEAVDLFDYSIAVNERLGAHSVIAHTQYELARLLLARNPGSRNTHAEMLLERAASTARELDMPGLLAWITELKQPR